MNKYLIIVLFTAFLGWTACGGQKEKQEEPKTLDEVTQLLKEKKIALRDLERKIKELESLQQQLDTTRKELKPVKVDTLAFSVFRHHYEVQGLAESNENVLVSSNATGSLSELFVREGQQVKKGQLLAKIDASVIESNIAEVKTSLALARDVYEKQDRLWSQGIGSEMQYLQAKNNYEALQKRLATLNAQLDLYYVKAPVAGTVDELNVKQGEMVMAGTRLLRVVNLDKMEVNADVPESYLNTVTPGDTVRVRFATLPGYSVSGKVQSVGQVINPNNRTFRIKVVIPNPKHLVKPNLLATIQVTDYVNKQAIQIPSKYIQHDVNDNPYVLIAVQEGGQFAARRSPLELGKENNGYVEVLNGLHEGDLLITKGAVETSPGALLKIIP